MFAASRAAAGIISRLDKVVVVCSDISCQCECHLLCGGSSHVLGCIRTALLVGTGGTRAKMESVGLYLNRAMCWEWNVLVVVPGHGWLNRRVCCNN